MQGTEYLFVDCTERGVTNVVLIVQALEEKQKAAERALEEGALPQVLYHKWDLHLEVVSLTCSSDAQEKKDIEERLRSYVDIHTRACHNTPALPGPLRLSEERKAA